MTEIFGLPGEVFLMWSSAFFYAVATILLLVSFGREKTELMYSFLAFLLGMAFFHIFLGAGFYTGNMLLIHLGSFAALTGATFTLKFPLTVLSEPQRKPIFYSALAISWLIIVYLLVFPHDAQTMLWLVLGYMIIVSGGIAGTYIIWQGMNAKETWVKVKCIGGGGGLFICCFVADALVLMSGVTFLSEFFMMLAPVVLISSIYAGRYLQKVSENKVSSGAPSPISAKK